MPTRIVECLSYGVSYRLVQSTDLPTPMPRQFLDFKWQDSVSVLPLKDAMPPITMQLITRRNSPPTPATRMLIDCLRDHARRQGLH